MRHSCAKKGIKLEKIGSVGKGKKYPLFRITLNDVSRPRKTVCFSAGIHGDEIAGPLAVLKLVENFRPKRFPGIRIIILPVANPSAFDKRKNRNFLNRDLNGHFCDRILTGENKILYDSVKNEGLFFFHALHEDCDEKRFYLYNFENERERIYRDIIRMAARHFPINANNEIYGDKADGGLIVNRKDGSFEDRLFRDGVPFTMCTETPMKASLQKRIKLNVEMMNKVLEFSEMADESGGRMRIRRAKKEDFWLRRHSTSNL